MPPLSTSAQKVQDALVNLGLDRRVIEFAESTRTAQEAADRVGCQLAQIVKSMLFKGQPILVLTSGANRVNEKLISRYVGEAVVRADPDFVRKTTGFAIGGVPPLGHNQSMHAFIDEDLMIHQTVWAAAGNPNAVFDLTPAELQKISGGEITRVK